MHVFDMAADVIEIDCRYVCITAAVCAVRQLAHGSFVLFVGARVHSQRCYGLNTQSRYVQSADIGAPISNYQCATYKQTVYHMQLSEHLRSIVKNRRIRNVT